MNEFGNSDTKRLVDTYRENPQKGLLHLRELQKTFGTDELFKDNLPSFLIDIGSRLRDASIIDEGVQLLEKELQDCKDHARRFKANRWYNLGNGHYAAEDARRGRAITYTCQLIPP